MKAALVHERELGDMRIVQFSVRGAVAPLVRLVVEVADHVMLALRMRGFSVRLARGLNVTTGRHGRVFADRYDVRVLEKASDVAAVLENATKNAELVSAPRTKLLRRLSAS